MTSHERFWHRLFGLASYALGVMGLVALAALVVGLGLEWLPPRPMPPSPMLAWPWLVNAGWLVLFAAQHSGMARHGFKAWLSRFCPTHLQRSLYVAASGLAALGLALTWQPLPGEPLWRGPLWLLGFTALAALGLVVSSWVFDHLDFFGLRPAWTGHDNHPSSLIIRGPYRFVRHPLMLCLIAFLWIQPTMTPTLAFLSGGLTLYVLIALFWEERDMVRQFGQEYEEYRRQVPALLPRLRPAPRRDAPAG